MKKHYKLILFIVIILLFKHSIFAQVAINTDGSSADASAILDVKSIEKGVLFPRLSQTQIANITNPADGLIVYCTTDGKFYAYVSLSGSWKELAFGSENIYPAGIPCPGTPTVNYGGQIYNTVQIGTQCWLKENLNIGTRINGSYNMADNSIIEKYCYSDDENNCDIYGGIYQWNELMQYSTEEGIQGICPIGWHIPSDNEWKILELELGMTQSEADKTGWRGVDEGSKIKKEDVWANENDITNQSGFSAYPTGKRNTNPNELWYGLGISTNWWTSTRNGASIYMAYSRSLTNHDNSFTEISRNSFFTVNDGLCVRCIKD